MRVIEFAASDIVVREVCNGIIFCCAAVMVYVFGHFIWIARRGNKEWQSDRAVWAAGAIMILLVGHLLRAGSSWMEFLWLDMGWDNTVWADALALFLASIAFIVVGKVLMIIIFVPDRWSMMRTMGLIAAAIIFPVILRLVLT